MLTAPLRVQGTLTQNRYTRPEPSAMNSRDSHVLLTCLRYEQAIRNDRVKLLFGFGKDDNLVASFAMPFLDINITALAFDDVQSFFKAA